MDIRYASSLINNTHGTVQVYYTFTWKQQQEIVHSRRKETEIVEKAFIIHREERVSDLQRNAALITDNT